jgi:hypothetical protein
MVDRGLDAPDLYGTLSGPDAATPAFPTFSFERAGLRRERPTHISRCGHACIPWSIS